MVPIRRVWITRARPGAERTAARLAALGFTPLAFPLLSIRRLPDALVDAPPVDGASSVAFTSPNGVAAFAALTGALRTRPAFAVGDATADAARQAGFVDVRSAAGDIHALAALIASTAPRGSVLAPGAREPAGDLAALLPGFPVRRLAVYAAEETGAAPPDAFDAVLLHSPRAARALSAAPPESAFGRIAVCISEAAAAPLARLSFAEIRIAATPDEPSMLTALGKPAAPV